MHISESIQTISYTPCLLVVGGVAEEIYKEKNIKVVSLDYAGIQMMDLDTEKMKQTNMPPLPAGRFEHAVVTVDNDLYVIAGANHVLSVLHNKSVNMSNTECSLLKLDIEKCQWEIKASLHVSRCQFTALFLENHILAVGGWNQNDKTISSVEAYNIDEDCWEIKQDLPVKIDHTAGCVFNGMAYISGGRKPRSRLIDDIYAYNKLVDKWVITSKMNQARQWHMMCASNQYMFMFGGQCGDKQLNTMEIYNPTTKQCTLLSSTMPMSRLGTNAVFYKESIYTAGGWDNNISDTILIFNTLTETWRVCNTKLSKPTDRCACAMAVIPTFD